MVGTWNVAALKDTEKDLGKWFVEGKGVVENSAGFHIKKLHMKDSAQLPASKESREQSEEQESTEKHSETPDAEPAALPDGDEISIYVLGLQEIVDISSPTEALRPYTDPGPAQKWKRALLEALPPGYELVAEQQLTGLLLLVAASPSVAPNISSVSTTSVGTGLFGYMGNKGAVAVRLVLGASTKLVFVNCHLAAGSEKASLERRNWDAAQILQRTKFDPLQDEMGMAEGAGEMIGGEDMAWWFGDLNYRLEGLPGDDVRRLLMLHTQGEYGSSKKSEQRTENDTSEIVNHINMRGEGVGHDSSSDSTTTNSSGIAGSSDTSLMPGFSSNSTTSQQDTDSTSDQVSLSTTLASLLTHDQLYKQQATRKAFHEGWREGPIKFLPTYKYDVGSVDVFDSSDKKRGPSWCDRILFRTLEDKQDYERRIKEEDERRKRVEESKVGGLESAVKGDEEILFDYDPETDGANSETDHSSSAPSDQEMGKKSSSGRKLDNKLQLEAYTSHQGTISSDHKPLFGLFTISYDSVVAELKEKIYREVAREFDKAENEERPGVTIVVDHGHDDSEPENEHRGYSLESGVDSIMFGNVRYREEKIRTFTVANTSRVSARFTFLPDSADKRKGAGLPSWLSLQYDSAGSEDWGTQKGADDTITIQPGEAVNIALRLRVDTINLVRALNKGTKKLERVLILSVHGGRDYFIHVRGIWMLSCFGRSLEELSRVPAGGVRALQEGLEASQNLDKRESRGAAPREIFRLTETIEDLAERTAAGWSMTEGEKGSKAFWEIGTGWPFDKTSWTLKDHHLRDSRRLYVHEALDTDQPPSSLFPPELSPLEGLEIIAEVLLDFLASLKDGIITATMWVEIEKGIGAHEKAKKLHPADEERFWIFEILSSSPVHNVSFVFLISMLARVILEFTSTNKQDKEEITPSKPTSTEPGSPSKSESGGKVVDREADVPRQDLVHAYARIFADVMCRGTLPSREKEKRVAQQRRRYIIELFLNGRLEAE